MNIGSTGSNRWLTYITNKLTGFTYFLDKLKLVFGKSLVQTKFLSTNNNTTGIKSELGYSNLSVNKWYKLKIYHAMGWAATTQALNVVQISNGGNEILVSQLGGQHNSGNSVKTSSYVIFQATGTTIEVALTNTGASVLSGNGTLSLTHTQLEELPNHEETTKFS